MIRFRLRDDDRALVLWLAIVLALWVRLMGPWIGANDRPGHIAICAGTEIIYIAQPGSPPDTGGGTPDPHADHAPCLWHAHFMALLVGLALLALITGRARTVAPPCRRRPTPPAPLLPFQARGPPLPVHRPT